MFLFLAKIPDCIIASGIVCISLAIAVVSGVWIARGDAHPLFDVLLPLNVAIFGSLALVLGIIWLRPEFVKTRQLMSSEDATTFKSSARNMIWMTYIIPAVICVIAMAVSGAPTSYFWAFCISWTIGLILLLWLMHFLCRCLAARS